MYGRVAEGLPRFRFRARPVNLNGPTASYEAYGKPQNSKKLEAGLRTITAGIADKFFLGIDRGYWVSNFWASDVWATKSPEP